MFDSVGQFVVNYGILNSFKIQYLTTLWLTVLTTCVGLVFYPCIRNLSLKYIAKFMIALYRVINNMHLCIGLVCRFLQYTMASLRNVISHMFNKYSLATNTLTSGLLMGLGDLIVQNISVLGASDQINLQYTS